MQGPNFPFSAERNNMFKVNITGFIAPPILREAAV